MSEVSKVFNKDGLDIGSAMGIGSGDRSGGNSNSALGNTAGTQTPGTTFLTEPLWGQFVELLTEQSFVRQIARSIPMDQPTLRVPAISTGLNVYATTEGAEATATSMLASDFLLEAKKIMAQVVASAELYEDSVQNIEKIITDDFVRAIAQAEEQAFLLGRVTKAGDAPKGGIKSDADYNDSANGSIQGLTNAFNPASGLGGTPTYQYDNWGTSSDYQKVSTATQAVAGSPLTICDGVVTTALDEGNIIDMQGSSFYGGNAYKAVREAIYQLGLLGRQRNDLVLILNPVSANQLLQSDELMTLDKYGANATILTGEVGSLFGVKILESSFLPTNGINIAGTTSSDGIFGQGAYAVMVHKPSLMLGDLRKVQVENERIIQNDAFRTVVSERIAFGMERRAGAVVIGNIDTSISSLSSSSVFYSQGIAPNLSANKTSIAITTDEGEDTSLTLTVDAYATDNIIYLGADGIPAGTIIKADLDGGTNFEATIADINVAQTLTTGHNVTKISIKGAGGTANGTGTIKFQAVDNNGNVSNIVNITVAITGQE